MRYETWGRFGAAIIGLGVSIIFNTVLIFIVNKYTSVTALIIAVIVGMAGLFVIFLGIRICSWDEGPKISRIDSKLDYQFLLTFKGRQQKITDFSEMEEVLTAFDLGKEEWSLRIVPPIGSLSEWRGYYDYKRNIYMTEITVVRKKGNQKWGLGSDYTYLEILNNELKKVIADKKKPRLSFFVRIDDKKGF